MGRRSSSRSAASRSRRSVPSPAPRSSSASSPPSPAQPSEPACGRHPPASATAAATPSSRDDRNFSPVQAAASGGPSDWRSMPTASAVPAARHLLRAKDLADARFAESLDRRRSGTGRQAVTGPLQSRVPPRLRRVAAPVPADAPPRTRRRAAAHDGLVRGPDLLRRRLAERRIVHDQLRPDVRRLADGLPGPVPRGRLVRPGAGRASCACTAGRDCARFEKTANAPIRRFVLIRSTPRGGPDDHDRQRPAVGDRPGRGPGVLHRQARHGGAFRCDPARDGQLPLADGRSGRSGRRSPSC